MTFPHIFMWFFNPFFSQCVTALYSKLTPTHIFVISLLYWHFSNTWPPLVPLKTDNWDSTVFPYAKVHFNRTPRQILIWGNTIQITGLTQWAQNPKWKTASHWRNNKQCIRTQQTYHPENSVMLLWAQGQSWGIALWHSCSRCSPDL